VDPARPALNDVLLYLLDLFEDKKAFSSVKGAHSAITSVVPEIDGISLTSNEFLRRFMKSLRSQRPPQPWYGADDVFDVEALFSFFEKQPPNSELPPIKLRCKAIILLHLFSRVWSGDLAQVPVSSIKLEDEGKTLQFFVGHSKTSRGVKHYWVPAIEQRPLICPVLAVQVYLERTAGQRRGADTKLFVGDIAPYNAIRATTIRKATAHLMQRAEVPDKFKPHALRMAASSCLLMHDGVAAEDVALGLWGLLRVFKAHYTRFLPGFVPPAASMRETGRLRHATR
jgi:hypothetical protein